jgi:hypothetical protein
MCPSCGPRGGVAVAKGADYAVWRESMNDPHVNSLTYEVKAGTGAVFHATSPIKRATPDFDLVVKDGKAIFSFKEHFASEGAARQVAEAFIQAWQLWDGLERSPGELCFIFQGADVVDLAPEVSVPRPAIVEASATSMAVSWTTAVPTVSRDYPPPPYGFIASEDVMVLYFQYEALLAGRMPLGTVAYFAHSLLEDRGGGRRGASKMHEIHLDVLRKIGELTSTKGGKEARKAEGRRQSFSEPEKRWLTAVIRALIKRVGEVDAGSKTITQITMSSLPPIDP